MNLFDDDDILGMILTIGGGEAITLDGPIDSATVYAIVDLGHRAVQFSDGEVSALAPSVTVRTIDVEDFLVPGDLIQDGTFATVREVSYRVLSHQPDGQGFSVLILGRDE